MSQALALTLSAFWLTKLRSLRLDTREKLHQWQQRKLLHFLERSAPKAGAFAKFRGHPLTDFPVMDKARLMNAFHLYNTAGITAEAAWQAFESTGCIGKYSIGASTGTSGNRGLYAVSDAERYLWLGTLLAKALPDMLHQRYRVAVLLPRGSRLYDAANESGRLALKFFDLSNGLEQQMGKVAAFSPNVLVAPPHSLVTLARSDLPLALVQVFSGAEVLDAADRTEIESRFGLRVREIYMATEGLLGVACRHGKLHLCEDCVAFEWEHTGALSAPVVTDFTRRTQIMIRYRMNDLLRLDPAPCPCGSPLQAVSEIVGRADDTFYLSGPGQQRIRVTPDLVRNAVVGASRAIRDFRVTQTASDHVLLQLQPAEAAELSSARTALYDLFARLGAQPILTAETAPIAPPKGGKLRRVIRSRDVPGAGPGAGPDAGPDAGPGALR